jgi:hypothetical protein
MPYYLVTHTSLVDADSEIAAAQKVLTGLQTDESVGFTVKLDEENTTEIIVSQVPAPDRCSRFTRRASRLRQPGVRR